MSTRGISFDHYTVISLKSLSSVYQALLAFVQTSLILCMYLAPRRPSPAKSSPARSSPARSSPAKSSGKASEASTSKQSTKAPSANKRAQSASRKSVLSGTICGHSVVWSVSCLLDGLDVVGAPAAAVLYMWLLTDCLYARFYCQLSIIAHQLSTDLSTPSPGSFIHFRILYCAIFFFFSI